MQHLAEAICLSNSCVCISSHESLFCLGSSKLLSSPMRALDVQTHRLRACKGIFTVFLVALGTRIPLRLARNLHACIPRVFALDFVNPFSHAFHFFCFSFQQQRSKALAAFHSLSQGMSRRQAKRLQLFVEWAMRSWSTIQLVQQSSRDLSRCTSISRAKRHAVSTSRNASLLAL